MPGTCGAYLNDNIRTEHLKCSYCRTQVYLIKIESDDEGGEIRTFGCPHCATSKSLRLTPRRRILEPAEFVADQAIC
jgi:DNA-directed RNA polymerase subunit RPC12/RpoP